MSNGHVCCILGVCCPPGSPGQATALATQMEKWKSSRPAATRLVSWFAERFLGQFDLAPKGLTAAVLAHGGLDGSADELATAIYNLYAPLFAEAAKE